MSIGITVNNLSSNASWSLFSNYFTGKWNVIGAGLSKGNNDFFGFAGV